MKPYPWKCATCREKEVSPVVLPTYTMQLDHDGRTYTVTLNKFRVLKCGHCNSIILDDEADEKLSEALRAEVGLLSPSEIRTKRELLNLTQKQLGNLLQISESTVSRWETGAQIQQRCIDTFLRCFFDLVEVRQYLGLPNPAWMVALESIITELPLSAPQTFSPKSREFSWGSVEIVGKRAGHHPTTRLPGLAA